MATRKRWGACSDLIIPRKKRDQRSKKRRAFQKGIGACNTGTKKGFGASNGGYWGSGGGKAAYLKKVEN